MTKPKKFPNLTPFKYINDKGELKTYLGYYPYEEWRKEFEAMLLERCNRCRETAKHLDKPTECENNKLPKDEQREFPYYWECDCLRIYEILEWLR